MLEFFYDLLDPEDAAEFALWAFGEEPEDLQGLEFMHAWNERHGDVLELEADGLLCIDAPKMIMLWRDSREND